LSLEKAANASLREVFQPILVAPSKRLANAKYPTVELKSGFFNSESFGFQLGRPTHVMWIYIERVLRRAGLKGKERQLLHSLAHSIVGALPLIPWS
jgi:hypothetical protein